MRLPGHLSMLASLIVRGQETILQPTLRRRRCGRDGRRDSTEINERLQDEVTT